MRDDEIVRRFLLGELRETKAESVEKRLLEDDEFFDLCEAVEAELLDAAVRGELAPAERDRILKRLASSPQGCARLALARSLAAEADRQKTSAGGLPVPLPFRRRPALAGRPAVRWAIAAGLLVLLGGTGTWVLFHPGDRDQIAAPVNVEEPNARTSSERTIPITSAPPVGDPAVEKTPAEAESVPASPPRDRIAETKEPEEPAERDATPVVFELSFLTFRSGEEPKPIEEIQIPRGKEHIELHVDVTFTDYDSYDAVVKRGEEEIFRKSHFEPTPKDEGLFVVFDLPASVLPPGRYTVEVHGRSADGSPEPVKSGEIEVTRGE